VPAIPGSDTALRYRLLVFPFNEQLAPGDPRLDPDASIRFKRDPEFLNALFAWMVAGWSLYCKERLHNPPKAMQQQNISFMAETDHFQDWFHSTFIADESATERTDRINGSYENWCNAQDVHPRDRLGLNRALPGKLEDAGFTRAPKVVKVGGEVHRLRVGYRFRTEREQEDG